MNTRFFSPLKSLLLAMLVAMLLAMLTAQQASAAACCVSATSSGVGRLRIWEDFAVGTTQSATVSLGQWSVDGKWQPYGKTYAEQEWRPSLWGIVRLSERLQVSAVLPGLLTHREATKASEVGGGLGDMAASARYALIEIGEYLELPALALSASLRAPSGRSMDQASAPLGVDTTGRGPWALTLGTSVEKTHLPFFVQLNTGLTLSAPFRRADIQKLQIFGPSVAASVLAGAEVLPDKLMVSASVRASLEAPVRTGGEVVEHSSRFDLGVGASVSWLVHPFCTLIAAVDSGLFLNHLGNNTPGRVTVSGGLRLSYF